MATILIVEDNPDNMKLFQAVLGLAGHRTVGLPDGHGLLPTIADLRPDLVLLDIQLPDHDGFTLLGQIRADSRWAGVPVVALTAHAMAGDEEKARRAGFDGYITKPIDVRGFAGQVAAAVRDAGGTEFA